MTMPGFDPIPEPPKLSAGRLRAAVRIAIPAGSSPNYIAAADWVNDKRWSMG